MKFNVDMSKPKEIAKLIASTESTILSGHNDQGEEVYIALQQGVGMTHMTKHASKPKWLEVVEYDADGYVESLSYQPACDLAAN
ncbi:hypothetical protein RFF05_06940 [Bengtsoniella intestinalis]|uniref:hypothetical protein n=1 Tax=Bengtsoniella intestinalis TaxID=3073143 RepID=UPI00391F9C47